MSAELPILDAIPALIDALRGRGRAVLQAPPGAGKTTVVPLEMLRAGLTEGRIVMLEPRRLAARAAAERMAATLGEEVGGDGGLPHPGRGAGVARHPDRGGHGRHSHPHDPVGAGPARGGCRDLRRVSRTLAQRRSRARAVPRAGRRAAPGSHPAGDVGHARRGPGGGAHGRAARQLRGPQLSGRDALARPAAIPAGPVRGRGRRSRDAGHRGDRGRRAGLSARRGRDPAGRGAAPGPVARGLPAAAALRRDGRGRAARRDRAAEGGAQTGAGDRDRRDLADDSGYPRRRGWRPRAARTLRSRARGCRVW